MQPHTYGTFNRALSLLYTGINFSVFCIASVIFNVNLIAFAQQSEENIKNEKTAWVP